MINKKVLVLMVLIYSIDIFSHKVLADDNIDCSSVDLVTSVFNDPIELTSTGGVIKVYENVTINEILSTSNNEFEVKYLDARLETIASGTSGNINKNLVIYRTENFQNYAREQTAARISLKINLGCGMGKERIIVFFQPFKEGNYFSPIFSQALYELTMPTPIFSGFDLTSFIDISARDDDLTNNQINFTSITSSQYHISVGTKNVTSDDKKTYFANLTLERIYLELPQQIEFVIIATDNGIPPRTSNASIVIRSNPRNSLPALPRFEQKLYTGNINVVFSMEPIPIKLTRESYDPQVKFTLSGSVMDGFEMLDTGNGSIEILWNATKVNQTYIMANKRWQLEIKAEHPNLAEFSVATILVELADFQSYFHFMSLYYDGHLDTDEKLHMTPIIFYPFIYKPDINFTFLENPLNMFAVTNEGFRVGVQLMSNFSLNAFANNSFIKLAVQASWEQLSAVCYIVIELPLRRTGNQQQMFQFEKPLYVGNITELHVVQMEMMALQTDANATQLNEFQLIGEWSHLFRLNVNGSHVKLDVIVTRNITELHLKSPILLVLEARNSIAKATTSLVINIIQKPNLMESKDIFKSHTVVGKLSFSNGTQILSVDSIALKPLENLKDYKFSFEGSNISEYFELQPNVTDLQLQLLLKDPLPNITLEVNQFLMLNIVAKLNEFTEVSDTVVIFIELPLKECSNTLPSVHNPPTFINDNYVFTSFTNETGSLGFLNAHVKGSNATLHYILEVDNNTLAQSLSVNPFSGELLLYGILAQGTYKFNITAENVETHEKVRIQALLKVQAKVECRIYEGPVVEKTLVVKHIDEERNYHGLWNLTVTENCTFHILEMWPKEKAYVYVNESSYMLDILPVDREDLVFKDMIEAEIIVKLRLMCGQHEDLDNFILEQNIIDSNNRTLVARSLAWPYEDILYTQNITFSPDIMWLHLKIDDINDNAPQFVMSNGPQYLGYPSGKIALDVYPEYLTQIMATDRDLGLNAKIRYTLRENEYFAIDPETGKIYPKGRILQPQQQTELIVLAVDQDGKGLMSGTVVIVKGLEANFYSLITIEANSSKLPADISQELSVEMGCDVKILKMSYVPQMETGGARAGGGRHGLLCKAWIYAFRDQQLVECKELQGKFLKNSPTASIVNIESYEEASPYIKHKTPSTVGYIVAVSLLSVISCSSIVVIIWRFYYCKGKESDASTKGTTLSPHHLQQPSSQNHENGQTMECSYGDNNKNHVKFSSLVDNANSDDLCQKL